MNKPQLELADVVRRFAGPYKEQFGHLMLPSHHRALQDIAGCMTEAMGGGRYHCHDCSETFWSYHGCRNRSCPKCHGRQIVDWLKCRSAEILPCRYFHLVATVPSELRRLFLRHQKTLYGLLMKTASSFACPYVGYRRRRDRGRDRLARCSERISRTGKKTLAHDCQAVR